MDELAQVDGRKEALKLILNEPGTITPYGVVYDNGMELEQLYREGGPFPEYVDRQYSMLLEASAGEGQSTLLLLPDSQARLERLLGRAGIQLQLPGALPGGGQHPARCGLLTASPWSIFPYSDSTGCARRRSGLRRRI